MILLKPKMTLFFKNKKKNKRFNTVNCLSQLNENVLSPNRFEQLTVEDDAKETVNIEKYDDNSNNNSTRTTTKESYVSEANLNLDYSSRPRKIANSQTHLTTHERPTTVVNRRPESQDIYKSKKVVPGRQTYGETIGKRNNNIVIFGDSITNFSRCHKNIFNKKIDVRKARFKYFPGVLSRDILYYVILTLDKSAFDVAIIKVGINDLLNCEGDIDQFNNILQNIEHIVYKCRQYSVKNTFLSGLTITNRLPEQLIKKFNMSIRNICNRTQDCDYIDNAKITLNEVCRDGLHLSGKGKYVLINNYLDKVLKFFRSNSVPTDEHT